MWTSLNQSQKPLSNGSISFCPASHTPESFLENDGLWLASKEDPTLALLRAVAEKQAESCTELLHSSFHPSSDEMLDTFPQRNGFVHTVIEAYNRHRALIVRPDDVWLAILTQFCFFVNGNAENLRNVFVAHEGKKELVIQAGGDRYSMNPAYMAVQMTHLMQQHIIDESLQEWITPSFTTTTATDTATSAIVMMGTMKEYFSYSFHLLCGIPKVTLEGEKRDWEDILHRLERLKKYGIQTIAWYHLLRPVISRFVSAYDDPTSADNLEFWNKVAHFREGGSGPTWLSGWITAFCVFNEQGRWKGNGFNEITTHTNGLDPLHLSAAEFASTHLRQVSESYLTLDGFPYPRISSDDVPCGYTHVDVKLIDNRIKFDTMFVAGLIGTRISSTVKTGISREGRRDTVQPITGWWYFIKEKGPGPELEEPECEAECTPVDPTPPGQSRQSIERKKSNDTRFNSFFDKFK